MTAGYNDYMVRLRDDGWDVGWLYCDSIWL